MPTCRRRPEVVRAGRAASCAHVNALLPSGLQMRRFVNLHKEFDADDGEITRTRKLRRNVIEERYAPMIEASMRARRRVEQKRDITYESGETGVIRRDAGDPQRGLMDSLLIVELAINGALVGLMYSLVAMGIVLVYKSSGVAEPRAGRHRRWSAPTSCLAIRNVLGRADVAGDPAGDAGDVRPGSGHRARGAAAYGGQADRDDPDDDAGPGDLPARRHARHRWRHGKADAHRHQRRAVVPRSDCC